MNKFHTLTVLFLAAGAMGLSACDGNGETDTDTDELDVCDDPTAEGFCDCPANENEAECDVCQDPTSDEYCDCPENREADACGGPIFEPWLIDVDAEYAYNPDTNSLADFVVEGNPATSSINILIYDERIQTTSNIAFACSIRLVANDPSAVTFTSAAVDFDWPSGSSGTYDTFGFTLAAGEYTVEDAPLQAQSGTIEGCLQKRWDADVVGDDPAAWLGQNDWRAGISGTFPAEVGDELEAIEDDPEDDWDIATLYQDGYIIGGGTAINPADDTSMGMFYYGYGFALDDSFSLIAGGDGGPDYQYLGGADMVPAEGNPARGLYIVRSSGLAWLASGLR